jgi:hypothetical protein
MASMRGHCWTTSVSMNLFPRNLSALLSFGAFILETSLRSLTGRRLTLSSPSSSRSGAKSFLDIKEEESVEYRAAPRKPEVNPVVIASGCDEHANIYGAYAVDVRAAMRALALEPRFLSITPSTGLVDLMAEETGDNVRALAFSESERIGGSGSPTPKHAAFLTVMGTWPNAASLQPNPVLYVKEDGTQVTDFPRGLAKWAGTTDEKRRGADTESAYWAAVNERIRTAENEQRLVGASLARGERVGAAEMFRFDCERKAQYSADHQSVKVIRFFEKWEIEDTFGNVCSYS